MRAMSIHSRPNQRLSAPLAGRPYIARRSPPTEHSNSTRARVLQALLALEPLGASAAQAQQQDQGLVGWGPTEVMNAINNIIEASGSGETLYVRSTVRAALQSLQQDGLIDSVEVEQAGRVPGTRGFRYHLFPLGDPRRDAALAFLQSDGLSRAKTPLLDVATKKASPATTPRARKKHISMQVDAVWWEKQVKPAAEQLDESLSVFLITGVVERLQRLERQERQDRGASVAGGAQIQTKRERLQRRARQRATLARLGASSPELPEASASSRTSSRT